MKKIKHISLSLLLVGSLFLGGCASVEAGSITDGIIRGKAESADPDSSFINADMKFSLELFKKVQKENEGKNVLISPMSVISALAMTANGATGETLSQMEEVLGGGIAIDQLNKYLYGYLESMGSGEGFKLHTANSVWIKDTPGLKVEQDFLQKTVDYYNSEVYREAFDDNTLKAINSWVNAGTDGMIPEIIDEIDSDSVMYLINALAFDAEWETKYENSQISGGTFTACDGKAQSVEMMRSLESVYLEDGNATGFIKDYKGAKYSFAALLPNEGISVSDYIAGLTPEALRKTVSEPAGKGVLATMPKFTFDFGLNINDILKIMGMPKAFDESADFTKMATSSEGNLYLGDVIHKTFIAVDEKGTKAGAATSVEVKNESAALIEDPKTVILDRPFVFMIIDNETRLPIFLGAVKSVK